MKFYLPQSQRLNRNSRIGMQAAALAPSLARRIPCFQESETKRGIVKNDFLRFEIQREARKGKEDSGCLT